MGKFQTCSDWCSTWFVVAVLSTAHALISFLDAHGHDAGGHAAHGPETASSAEKALALSGSHSDIDASSAHHVMDSAFTQIIGVAILEFGVALHRFVLRTFGSSSAPSSSYITHQQHTDRPHLGCRRRLSRSLCRPCLPP